jgi:stage II sporulation protein M
MFSIRSLLQAWKEIRPYFIFSIILFFAGMVIGGTPNEELAGFFENQLKGIQSISNSISTSSNPEMTAFMLITLNNVYITIMAMGLGIIAGIMPAFMLVSNGMVMGYLLSGFSAAGENVFLLIVKGLLPHGILELSAVFLGCAYGMRYGITLIKGIFGSAFGKENAWQPFVRTAIGSVPALIAVVVLLLLGAIVESTITYWLMKP